MRDAASVFPARTDVVAIFQFPVIARQPNRLEIVNGIVGDSPSEHIPTVLPANNLLANVCRIEKNSYHDAKTLH